MDSFAGLKRRRKGFQDGTPKSLLSEIKHTNLPTMIKINESDEYIEHNTEKNTYNEIDQATCISVIPMNVQGMMMKSNEGEHTNKSNMFEHRENADSGADSKRKSYATSRSKTSSLSLNEIQVEPPKGPRRRLSKTEKSESDKPVITGTMDVQQSTLTQANVAQLPSTGLLRRRNSNVSETDQSLRRAYSDPVNSSISSVTPFVKSTGLSRRSSMPFLETSALGKLKYRSRSRRKQSISSLGTQQEEDTIELPQMPRFASKLSPEAQFAMLKGYEDVLCSKLTESFPEQSTSISRTSSPKSAKLKLDNLSEERVRQSPVPSSASPSVVGDVGRNRANAAPMQMIRRNSFGGVTALIREAVPLKKQLLLTYRFNNAMDIMDTMKSSKGQMVTSPRYASQSINPVETYNTWNHDWIKEFKQ